MLVPCTTCARHVRVGESVCPFCDRELPANLAARAVPGTTKRLTRAAFFTFATTLGAFGVLAACNGDDSGSPDADVYAGGDSAYGVPSTVDPTQPDANYGLSDAQFDAIEEADDASPDDASDGGDD